MSEERQQLLEQKRKRLQELKQRRGVQASQFAELPKARSLGVNVGTQTTGETSLDTKVTTTALATPTPSPRIDQQLTRFDVGVQATSLESDDVLDEDKAAPSTKPISKKEVFTLDLNEALIKSIKLINQLRIHESINLDQAKVESKANTEFIAESRTFKLDREISDIDVSSHKFVVGFVKSPKENYDGVIFNEVNGKLIPINYLTSIPVVSMIRFDVNKTNRLIGSTSNGGMCIWETESTSLMQSPTLSTPSTLLVSKRDWIPHLTELVLLQPLKIDTNECILTLSKDCVLNIWSSNLLSRPKYSIKLNDDSKHVSIKDAVYIGNDALIGEINENVLKMALAGFDGKIYNEKLDMIHEDKNSLVINSLESLSKNLVISAHSDWNLRLWKEGQTCPLKVISTSYVVTYIARRPHTDYQFITVGTFKRKYYVDLWDISKQLYSPLLRIVEETDPVRSVKFTESNDILVIKGSSFSLHSINKDYNWQMPEDGFDKGL
ncbi:hypothetical protein I9W82_002761 [Candida metapsilosis]|uniref:Uncharacterized protein n=1 Tax=Candida metapsilosis TaxID=273372 RepID=A0A8H7ZFJ5_9ASCO|nr:hypothetical protein I9W82_002761 [Candida metapsilosis]